MNTLRPALRLIALLLVCPLAACATRPPTDAPARSLLHDELFPAPAAVIDPAALFALSEPMRRYANAEIRRGTRRKSTEHAMFDALYGEGQLKLEYDATTTRNAAEAFDARMGNCLSLVIMTAAFAKYLDVPVRFQQVYSPATWSRTGTLTVSSGHVNLSLAAIDSGRPGISTSPPPALTIDFVPSVEASAARVKTIPESMIVAMYFNNRAAEELAAERPDEAYWWARAAILQQPTFMESYNTLGVVYRRAGHERPAEDVLRHVVTIEPENTIALSNLAILLTDTGRKAEAAEIQALLARIEPFPPFHFYDVGVKALAAQDFEGARLAFERELKRSAYEADSHFGLAVSLLQLGRLEEAEGHLRAALEHSTTRKSQELYSGKLDWLKHQGYRPPPARNGRLPAREG